MCVCVVAGVVVGWLTVFVLRVVVWWCVGVDVCCLMVLLARGGCVVVGCCCVLVCV